MEGLTMVVNRITGFIGFSVVEDFKFKFILSSCLFINFFPYIFFIFKKWYIDLKVVLCDLFSFCMLNFLFKYFRVKAIETIVLYDRIFTEEHEFKTYFEYVYII